MSDRMRKVDHMLQQVLSRGLVRTIAFPKGVFLTVSRVRTSPDLRNARVFFTVFPREYTTEVQALLRKSKRDIQSYVVQEVSLKFIPRLHFTLDKEAQKVEEIEALLDQVKE